MPWNLCKKIETLSKIHLNQQIHKNDSIRQTVQRIYDSTRKESTSDFATSNNNWLRLGLLQFSMRIRTQGNLNANFRNYCKKAKLSTCIRSTNWQWLHAVHLTYRCSSLISLPDGHCIPRSCELLINWVQLASSSSSRSISAMPTNREAPSVNFKRLIRLQSAIKLDCTTLYVNAK